LGGGFPGYGLYKTRDGWISVATLEQNFWERLLLELDLNDATWEDLEEAFVQKTAEEWEQWAKERDLPLAALRDVPQEKEETR
jgi:alpha-methylacyl-CoA racemase